MARDANRSAHLATIVLMSVAYATCEVASYLDGIPRPFGVIFGLLLLAASIALAFLLRPQSPEDKPSGHFAWVLAMVLVLPLLVEPLLRRLTECGFPLEMQLVNGLRILGLLLAGLSAWRMFRRLAGVVALFLAIFSSAMGDQAAIPYLLVLFALTGGMWLVLEHRSTESSATLATEGELTNRVALQMPYRELIVFGVLALFASVVAFAGPKKVKLVLGEWLPTSGGSGETDPFARSGIGDGPEEVAGDNARAAGMVESDKMIEDNKDALIDVVNDLYGQPHKPRKDQERMVAAGRADIIQNHKKLTENKKPSREFDTSRQGPKNAKPPESQKARGIIEVEGRTPLHVRVVAYDLYDSENARWREGRKPSGRGLEATGGDWMRVANLREVDWYGYGADDRHRLKVADLKDNLVPTPTQLTQFRIQRVDKPDYYEWDFDGVLALAGRMKTPPGIVVNTDCRTVDRSRLAADNFGSSGSAPFQLLDVPESLKPELTRIATEWAGDQPHGWPQISAILTRLRSEYTLDAKASAPASHPAPVLWFLTQSRRGPDYLFASSATLLLRSLDYPARMCLGYYAAPEAFDAETNHTPITKDDVHLWPEVLLKDGHWLVAEATPGYDVLPPLLTWAQWFDQKLTALNSFVKRNAIVLGLLVLGFASVVWKRRQLLDQAFTFAWKLRPGRTWQHRVLNAARVLDRRGSLAGQPRAASNSLSDWMQSFSTASELRPFLNLADQAAYAPELPPPMSEDEMMRVCADVLSKLTLDQFVNAEPGVAA